MTVTHVCLHVLYSVKIGAIAVRSLSCVTIPRTVAHQAPLSMEFSRQDYWSGLPFPFLGDLPDAGIEPRSPALQADSLPSNQPGKAMSYNTFPSETCVERIQVISVLVQAHSQRFSLPLPPSYINEYI